MAHGIHFCVFLGEKARTKSSMNDHTPEIMVSILKEFNKTINAPVITFQIRKLAIQQLIVKLHCYDVVFHRFLHFRKILQIILYLNSVLMILLDKQ